MMRKERSKNQTRSDSNETFGLSPQDIRTLRSLKTPALIQKFVDGLAYKYANTAGLPSAHSASAQDTALKARCWPPQPCASTAARRWSWIWNVHDDDHVLALYREGGLWGGVAKSNFAGLRFRAPVYRTLRELALSYFEHYYNLRGERTLRSYSVPINLARIDSKRWMTAEEDVWAVTDLLIAARHYPLFPDKVARALPRLDRRSFEAGMHGWTKH